MRSETDLMLLKGRLRQLAETPYLSPKLHDFTDALVSAIDAALQQTIAPLLLKNIADSVALSYQYLAGSTSREAPHEIKYCLEGIIPEWIKRECVITTSLESNRAGFHFQPIDPWNIISKALPKFGTSNFNAMLVLMGLPKLYQHKPVFCNPLYHELGHFVDISLGITNASLITHPVVSTNLTTLNIIKHHRMEYFADLFSASYVGESGAFILEEIASNHPASITHPATSDRCQEIRSFLSGTSTPVIDMFQEVLRRLSAPALVKRFVNPNIAASFGDLRPHRLNSTEELHGIFNASWNYLTNALTAKKLPHSTREMPHDEIVTIVNDLTEKTIRNYAIGLKWKDVSTHPKPNP